MKIIITFLFLCFVSIPVEAKRYIIPENSKVMLTINSGENCISELPATFSVLVWNMYKGLFIGWQEDFKRLSENKSILILQEGLLNQRMSDELKNSPFAYYFATSFIDTKYGIENSGVLTGSKYCTQDQKWQRSYYREPFIRTPKMTLFTKYRISGSDQELLVGNIHGINFVRTYKLRHMMNQAKKMIQAHDGPVIFAGDFNTWSKRKLRSMRNIFKSLGMKEVRFNKDQRKSFFRRTLDHVWYKGLKQNTANAIHTRGSDHAPMEVEFTLK